MKSTLAIKVPVLVILMIAIASLLFSNSYQRTLAQINNRNQTITLLTYKNPDLGLTMQYPSNWMLQKDNLAKNTIAAFLLKEDRFHNTLDFANVTLAEVDLRVYPAPQGVAASNLNVGQLDTQGQALITQYRNSSTTLGGLPAIKFTSYFFGGITQKTMQVWTHIPAKPVLVAIMYIAQPSSYSTYLPAVQQMIDSVKIASTSISSTIPTAPASGGTTASAHTAPTQQIPTNHTTNVPQSPGSSSAGSKSPSSSQNGLGSK